MMELEARSRGRPEGAETALAERADGLPVVAPAPWEPKAVKPIHEALADLVLANPGWTAAQYGQRLNRGPTSINLILRSDLFRQLLEKRREDFVEPVLQAKVEDLFEVAISESVKVMGEAVSKTQDFELAERTLAAIGPMSRFGAKVPPVQLNQQFVVPLPERATSSEGWEELAARRGAA